MERFVSATLLTTHTEKITLYAQFHSSHPWFFFSKASHIHIIKSLRERIGTRLCSLVIVELLEILLSAVSSYACLACVSHLIHVTSLNTVLGKVFRGLKIGLSQNHFSKLSQLVSHIVRLRIFRLLILP